MVPQSFGRNWAIPIIFAKNGHLRLKSPKQAPLGQICSSFIIPKGWHFQKTASNLRIPQWSSFKLGERAKFFGQSLFEGIGIRSSGFPSTFAQRIMIAAAYFAGFWGNNWSAIAPMRSCRRPPCLFLYQLSSMFSAKMEIIDHRTVFVKLFHFMPCRFAAPVTFCH